MTDKPKRPRDANQLAHMIAGIATGSIDDSPKKSEDQRRGGLKGGKARAAKLSPEERHKIASEAAKARWSVAWLRARHQGALVGVQLPALRPAAQRTVTDL